jgi:hypothetical protein
MCRSILIAGACPHSVSKQVNLKASHCGVDLSQSENCCRAYKSEGSRKSLTLRAIVSS